MWYDWLWLILLSCTGDVASSISKSKAITLCCSKVHLITEKGVCSGGGAQKKLMVGLIWKTSAPNAIYTAQTGGRDAHTHWEHESRPRSLIGADATFPPVDVWCRAPPSVFSLEQADVGHAPGAGLDKSGAAAALCGSTQIREELFTRDCGVLSFTTAHFPSFHHAAIEPNPSWNICCEAWAKK